MINPRKDKILCSLWLTKEEAENIFEKLKKEILFLGDLEIIGLILERAFKRGDFK